MVLQGKAEKLSALGVYFHIPFCIRPCDFCAFYQEEPKKADLLSYREGMEAELALRKAIFSKPYSYYTVFWGGGTPGLLPACDLERLGRSLLHSLPRQPVEWTVELAPSVVKADKLQVLRDLGVTRISLGIQSFNRFWLDKLGRRTTVKQTYSAIELIKEAGFSNLNFDLIFAVPGQSLKDWEAEMSEAYRMEPTHLSTYCLTFEEDTALWVKLSEDKISAHSVTEEADIYQFTWKFLKERGFQQYEISNFCLPGYECLHNINTWKMQDWLGLGPSASSQIEGRRFTNIADITKWLAGLKKGESVYLENLELTIGILAADSLVFGLRMNAGVSLSQLETRFPDISSDLLSQLIRDLMGEGYVRKLEDDLIQLTDEGRLLADAIGKEILNRFD